MSTRTVALKWRTESVRLDVPEGESCVSAAARHFGVPVDRCVLVYKGKRYRQDDAVVDASDALFGAAGPVLVLGTRAEHQLDAPSPAAALAARVPLIGPLLAWLFGLVAALACSVWRDWLPAAARAARGALDVVVLFLKSLVPRVPTRRPRRAEAAG